MEIREKSSPILWDLLRNNKFTAGFWITIYDIILGYVPKRFLHLLIDDVTFGEYVKGTLFADIDIYCNEFPLLSNKSLDFIGKINEFLIEAGPIGLEIHKYFIEKLIDKCQNPTYWEVIVINIQTVLLNTFPKELLDTSSIITNNDGSTKLAFEESEVLSKSLKHLNLLNYVRTTFVKGPVKLIPTKSSLLLLDAFKESAELAHKFNMNIELRTNMKKAGLRSQNSQLICLANQEREALFGYFNLSFEMYKLSKDDLMLEGLWK